MNKFIKENSINDVYLKLIEEILMNEDYIICPREIKTKEILNVSINITNPYNRFVTLKERNLSFAYIIGEWLWYERGSNDLNEISYYSKFWKKISDDNKTVQSAYGKRIYDKNVEDINQWEKTRNELEKDPFSRRALIFLANKEDVLGKDYPCTISLQFIIRNNRLNLIVTMRSNDLYLGFPNDVAVFTLLQEKMLIELQYKYSNLKMGDYIHNVCSMHIYDRDIEKFEKILKNRSSVQQLKVPKIENLNNLKILQENEEKIRNNNSLLLELDDAFCKWCNNILIDFSKGRK